MRLLLLLEPGFAVALVALVSRHLSEPTVRTWIGIAAVGLLALAPFVMALRKPRLNA
jgi:hypothetical protein